jgi:branched-chain amino acid transport system substrate-binding protein
MLMPLDADEVCRLSLNFPINRRAVLAAGALGLAVPVAQAETGVTDNRIRIGQSAVFSGVAQDFGIDYRAGILLAFSRINKAGGVLGRKLELVSYDDAYDPKRTADNTLKLIDSDQVFALMGYVATGNLVAALPIAERSGVPMFAPLVGTSSFRTTFNPLLFHVRASYEQELRKIISHLATLGIHDIAVVYQNSAFGKSNMETCVQIAQTLSVAVKQTLPMEITATDAKTQTAALLATPPGAVVMVMAGRMVEVFLNDYRGAKGAAPIYTLSVGITDAAGSAKRLNGKLEGVVTASIVPGTQQKRFGVVTEYQQDRAEFSEAIDSATALEGYIAGRVFTEGLRRAGKALTREGFVRAIEGMGTTKLADFPISYGPKNHNGSNFVNLEMYGKDGNLVR